MGGIGSASQGMMIGSSLPASIVTQSANSKTNRVLIQPQQSSINSILNGNSSKEAINWNSIV